MAAQIQKFDHLVFTSDFTAICDTLGAPYSRKIIEQILVAFREYEGKAIIAMRCTSRAADGIGFRMYFPGQSIDTTTIAARTGWIEREHSLARLVRSWTTQEAEQWCDFDPCRGLSKTWVYYRQLRPVETILSAEGVSAAVRARMLDFQGIGLNRVNFTAVDYRKATINVYFLVPEALTVERATRYISLARSTTFSEAEMDALENDVETMRSFMGPKFSFAVTLAQATGQVQRVSFYARAKEASSLIQLDKRIAKFFMEAPSHDPGKFMTIGWSFGSSADSRYMKGEVSYSGDMKSHVHDMMNHWLDRK
ncbi:Chain A like protein [Zymoseptoria brevis]|uniref:Aromatic prenyltransferase n=1 Tax=Zymoseptoria brevis TaxID=1047168 RepID=A0A0F4G8C4_9PEZI|nr:Chain A like protein [Zymoseptoria brevis]